MFGSRSNPVSTQNANAYMSKMSGSTFEDVTDVSDEQWIVNQAIFHQKSDLHAAKSWLIVGRTLFSRNFDIQVLSSVLLQVTALHQLRQQ